MYSVLCALFQNSAGTWERQAVHSSHCTNHSQSHTNHPTATLNLAPVGSSSHAPWSLDRLSRACCRCDTSTSISRPFRSAGGLLRALFGAVSVFQTLRLAGRRKKTTSGTHRSDCGHHDAQMLFEEENKGKTIRYSVVKCKDHRQACGATVHALPINRQATLHFVLSPFDHGVAVGS